MFVKAGDMSPMFCLNVQTDTQIVQWLPWGDRNCWNEISFQFARQYNTSEARRVVSQTKTSNRNMSRS